MKCLQLQDEIGEIADKVYAYANMRKDENNANTKYLGIKDRAQSLYTAGDGAITICINKDGAIKTAAFKTR